MTRKGNENRYHITIVSQCIHFLAIIKPMMRDGENLQLPLDTHK
jgi:hypothetical protein